MRVYHMPRFIHVCVSTKSLGVQLQEKVHCYSRWVLNYIAMARSYVEYAAGPLSGTVVDFWRLVWQERPPTLVMLTNLKEGKKVKCHKYWPDSGSQSFGPFRVTITDQQILADYTTRSFLLEVSVECAI